ncbi:MAG: hypothetical protein ABEI58_01865 [Candidatus Nanohaloarchaea archaeon]
MIVLASSFAAASPAELTIFPQESSTEVNSFTSYEVTIENVGPVKDVYNLGSQNSEVTIAPRQVELDTGDSETVNVWYNPGVDKEAGTYTFTVTATSRATDKKYTVDGTVNVIKEHKVDVAVAKDSKTVCRGEKATYTVEVTNNGNSKEEFRLTTDYGELSVSKVSLEDGETQTVKLIASSDKAVEKNFNVVAASTTSYAQDIQNVQFKSEICYASKVSITPETQEVAAFTPAEYQVTVRNTGTKADEFVLSTSKGELEATSMEIDGKSSRSTTLTFTPEKLGSQKVTVTAESEVTSRGTATTSVYNGMDVGVAFSRKSTDVCENERFTLEANVQNTGEAEETYKLKASRGNLSKSEVTLEPNETATVEVGFDASELKQKTYRVELGATSTTFNKPKKTAGTEFTVQNCWDLEMNVVPQVQSAGKNRSVIYEVRLENTGTAENTYRVSHNGPDWVSIKPSRVTVQPGQTETAFMYAGIPFQKKGELRVDVTAEGNSVNQSQTVRLLIDEEIKDAIKSGKGGSITGMFADAATNLSKQIGGANTAARVLLSILLGGLITAAVLLREW